MIVVVENDMILGCFGHAFIVYMVTDANEGGGD